MRNTKNPENYVKRIEGSQTVETATEIMRELIEEFENSEGKTMLIESRFTRGRRKRVEIWPFRILSDLDLRWREIVKLFNNKQTRKIELLEDGFEKIIEKRYPVIYGMWWVIEKK